MLLLQPQVAMVVVITSTGGVTKRVISYDEPLDAGLLAWAGSYLNEVLGGMDVGARMLGGKLADPELSVRERDFLATLAPAFTELEDSAGRQPVRGRRGPACSPSSGSRTCRSCPS